MMAYREVGPSTPLRLVLYYAIEGKYFGEHASGVGWHTDVYIMRTGKKVFRIKEKVLEDNLFKLCERLEPRELNQSHVDVLNSLPGTYIKSVSKLERIKAEGDWVIREGRTPKKSERADPSD